MPKKHDYKQVIAQHLAILEELRAPTGLFRASGVDVSTGYDKAWIRDNFYECLAFVVLEKWDVVAETYNALLNIFLKYEWKIDHAIAERPDEKHKYIHARFHPETFEEFWEEWGNKQNDSIGAILFMLGQLEVVHKRGILTTPDKLRVVQKLVDYLQSLQYWQDLDNGVWEEDEEVHASSVGACVAGLKAAAGIPGIAVNQELIAKGEASLNALLPRESQKKFVDLAQLSLIYPYAVTTQAQSDKILQNIEYHLLREHGIIRYKNDYYYNKNVDGHSEEAEWCFGFSWLAIIYLRQGNIAKAKHFLDESFRTLTGKNEIPELYYSHSDEYNENSPLGWAESMFVIALHEYDRLINTDEKP